jgi:hypothetical protein
MKRSPAIPNLHNNEELSMLFAVAAASPDTISFARTKNSPMRPATIISK